MIHNETAAKSMELWFLYIVRFVTIMLQLKIHRRVDDHPNIIRFLGISKGNGEKIQRVMK